jgi:hypothetical protein
MTEIIPNNEVAEQVLCDGCVAVPLSHLALEIPVPIAGWEPLFEEHKVKVVTDYIGRPAIAAAAARRLLRTLRRQDELRVEDAQRRSEKLAKKYPRPAGRGLPAQEGLSPFEVLASAADYQSVQSEFGRHPRPTFLQDELAAGDKALAEKQARAKELAARRLKRDLA